MEYAVKGLIDKAARIAVLCGGMSNEREVSLRSGKNVLKALRNLGYINAEIVDVNNCEGMIIDKGDNECIAKQIFKLYSNPSMLNNMKKMSYESRKRFSVDEYEELYKKCFD